MNEKDLKILEQYEQQIMKTCRGRGSYLCEGRRLFLLKEYKASEHRATMLQDILQFLSQDPKLQVDCFVANKEGKFVSRDRDERGFVLKEWYHGRECDVKKEEELFCVLEYLAFLHIQMQKMEPVQMNQPAANCQEEFGKRMRELKKIRNYIFHKRGKTQFEFDYLNCFQGYFDDALIALEGAKRLDSGKLQLCHGDFNQHNILMGEHGVSIVNFDKCHYGSQMEDLYLFMRKMLEKYDWDLQLGENMLAAYEDKKPIERWQQQELYMRFLFPEKFWKISNHYYNSRKVWGIERNQQKLDKLLEQTPKKQKFLNWLKQQSA